MKKLELVLSVLFAASTFSLVAAGIVSAEPKISNCDISPKEITHETEVTISFDYENVEGGLKEGKVVLNQKIQLPGEEKVVTRTSNWQSRLQDLSTYSSESGRFEKKFTNAEVWRGPQIDLTYEIKVIDRSGKESNICATKIRPK